MSEELQLRDRLRLELADAQAQYDVLADYVIVSDDEYNEAGEFLKQVKGKIKLLEEERKLSVQPMNEQVKEINAWFKPAVVRLETSEKRLKAMMGQYTLAKHAEQQRLLTEAAEAAREALESRLVTDTGPMRPEAAEDLLSRALESQAPRVEGVSVKEILVWEMVDEKLVPERFKSVDKRKIDEAVKAGVTEIPGIKFSKSTRVIARS